MAPEGRLTLSLGMRPSGPEAPILTPCRHPSQTPARSDWVWDTLPWTTLRTGGHAAAVCQEGSFQRDPRRAGARPALPRGREEEGCRPEPSQGDPAARPSGIPGAAPHNAGGPPVPAPPQHPSRVQGGQGRVTIRPARPGCPPARTPRPRVEPHCFPTSDGLALTSLAPFLTVLSTKRARSSGYRAEQEPWGHSSGAFLLCDPRRVTSPL